MSKNQAKYNRLLMFDILAEVLKSNSMPILGMSYLYH